MVGAIFCNMKWKILWVLIILAIGFGLGYGFVRLLVKYKTAEKMFLPVTELSTFDYPDDPAPLSTFYNRYNGRSCTLAHRGDALFDFTFDSNNPHVATVRFTDIDLSLIQPVTPEWVRGDSALETLTLVDREWNRQQVQFTKDSPHFSIEGGDGYEVDNLYSAEIARNCLNAGLWEILIFVKEEDEKRLLYHGWFTFPPGYYKQLFEKLNDLSYLFNWWRLEHWFSPEGKTVDLDRLRTIQSKDELKVYNMQHERVIAAGEQRRKLCLLEAEPVLTWGDFPTYTDEVRFATFVPPGFYDTNKPWATEMNRFATLTEAVHRTISSPASDKPLDEIELVFNDMRFIVSGIDLDALPTLKAEEYPQGLYMPMGIAVPPFTQSYAKLEQNPPQKSPYFAMLLDDKDGWLNHHKVGVDGPVMYRDETDARIIHLYFLSYERISLVAHYALQLKQKESK